MNTTAEYKNKFNNPTLQAAHRICLQQIIAELLLKIYVLFIGSRNHYLPY